ncbi:hypothetical protein [Pararhizobium sp. DWP3-4]|uniref:hypothetical protein n=1 Tax=Pararhizobium sp. DWP3-4 TaxID=2804565 RepID=UPI003CF4E668
MKVSRSRLSATGWIGAALFVLPTPIGAYLLSVKNSMTPGEVAFKQRLGEVSGVPFAPEFPLFWITALTTLTLVGAVMLIVGRETLTDS